MSNLKIAVQGESIFTAKMFCWNVIPEVLSRLQHFGEIFLTFWNVKCTWLLSYHLFPWFSDLLPFWLQREIRSKYLLSASCYKISIYLPRTWTCVGLHMILFLCLTVFSSVGITLEYRHDCKIKDKSWH